MITEMAHERKFYILSELVKVWRSVRHLSQEDKAEALAHVYVDCDGGMELIEDILDGDTYMSVKVLGSWHFMNDDKEVYVY